MASHRVIIWVPKMSGASEEALPADERHLKEEAYEKRAEPERENKRASGVYHL